MVKIETEYNEYLLDNLAIQEKSLAKRRITLHRYGDKVYPLRKRVHNISELIKYPTGTKFIDAEGHIFTYNKGNKFYSLKYYAIGSIKPGKELGSYIIWLPEIGYAFETFSYEFNYRFVGILDTPMGYIVYEFSEEHKPVTRRKI